MKENLTDAEIQTLVSARGEIRTWPYWRAGHLCFAFLTVLAVLLDWAGREIWVISSLSYDLKLALMALAGVTTGNCINNWGIEKSRLLVKLAAETEKSGT